MNKIRQDDSVFADFGVHKLCRLAYVFAVGESFQQNDRTYTYTENRYSMGGYNTIVKSEELGRRLLASTS